MHSHSQGRWGWAASMFSFCSVCFLFRSTAQFWFWPLRADRVWQVRISVATHLCLPQGCGLSSHQPLQEQEGLPALLIASPFFPFFSFSLFPSFYLSPVCLHFFPLSPSVSSLSWNLFLSFFLPFCVSFIQKFFLPCHLSPFSISPFLFLKMREINQCLRHLEV